MHFQVDCMVLERLVVNALSEYLEVETYKDGKIYYDRYEKGNQPLN